MFKLKKGVVLFLFLLSCITYSFAQVQYEVTAQPSLKIRNAASPNAIVVSKLNYGDRINVYTIKEGWAEIRFNGKKAYVNATYIKPCPSTTTVKTPAKSSFITSREIAVYEVISTQPLDVVNLAGYKKGTLQPGQKIEVYSIRDGKALIRHKGKQAYVNASYLKPCYQSHNKEFTPKYVNVDYYATGNVEWMIYVILSLAVVLLILRYFIKITFECDGNPKILLLINRLLFLVLAGFEFAYVLLMGSDALWFCQPSTVGWIWTIVNFILFGTLIYTQVISYFIVVVHSKFSTKIGECSWIIFAFITLLYSTFSWEHGYEAILYLFGACQLIQLFLIFKGVIPQEGIIKALWFSLLYLVASAATILMISLWIKMLIIAMLILMFIKGAFSNKRTADSLEDKSRNTVYGRRINDDTFETDSGKLYDRVGNTNEFQKRHGSSDSLFEN